MNPDTNQLEKLREVFEESIGTPKLVRPDGSPVPKHWAVFQVGETVVVKNYTFKVAYMNDGTLVLEPVGIPKLGDETSDIKISNV